MGHKGARLTNEINLSGRYVVLDPNVEKPSVSRRLSDAERERLRDIARETSDELGLEQFGVIVRTAAEGTAKDEIGPTSNGCSPPGARSWRRFRAAALRASSMRSRRS
jgi:Rne/Rng family ribonuclease